MTSDFHHVKHMIEPLMLLLESHCPQSQNHADIIEMTSLHLAGSNCFLHCYGKGVASAKMKYVYMFGNVKSRIKRYIVFVKINLKMSIFDGNLHLIRKLWFLFLYIPPDCLLPRLFLMVMSKDCSPWRGKPFITRTVHPQQKAEIKHVKKLFSHSPP